MCGWKNGYTSKYAIPAATAIADNRISIINLNERVLFLGPSVMLSPY